MQRVDEIQAAIKIISENPWGLDSKDLSENFKKNTGREWRGIHNAYLHNAVLWGFPGILLTCFALLIPLILFPSYLKFLTCLVFSIYSLTDTPFYLEIAPLLITTLGMSTSSIPSQETKKSLLNNSSLFIAICLSLSLPAIRKLQIKSKSIVSIIIDNPLDVGAAISLNNKSRWIIPAGEYRTIHLDSPRHQLIVETSRFKSHFSFTAKNRFKDLPRDIRLLSLDPSAEYASVFFSVHKNKVIKEEKFLVNAPFVEIPEDIVRKDIQFQQHIQKGFETMIKISSSGKIEPDLNFPFLIRRNSYPLAIYNCWEPARKPPYDPCLEKYSYGFKSLKNVFRF